ncbi:MAG: Crp/Fnr family transcriptional regulator [Clostridia bacterium]|nr:Crp/Fnr family transcriptional regulator [Clostridia bacterium]
MAWRRWRRCKREESLFLGRFLVEFTSFFPVWSRLTAQQQAALSGSVFSRKVQKGDVIHNGDADCTGLLLVRSGQLRAFILSQDGREITIYRLFERDLCLFSASCMMRSIQFEVTIEAEKDTELWVIPAEIYKQVMEESAPLSNFTNEVMATRFSDVMWLVEQIMWKSFDKRLAAFLLEEAAIEGANVLKITHEIIGNHMGNPREVVTRMLRYFQNEGMVKLSRGTIEITDEDALRDLAE